MFVSKKTFFIKKTLMIFFSLNHKSSSNFFSLFIAIYKLLCKIKENSEDFTHENNKKNSYEHIFKSIVFLNYCNCFELYVDINQYFRDLKKISKKI